MSVVVSLMGPTASGKTRAAMLLKSARPSIDLVSVDSAMVYRGMDVGTAKPTPDELARFPHDLVDIADPTDSFSAARFVEQADRLVKRSLDADRVPVLVGGTMLYFNAFKAGLNDMPGANDAVRDAIHARGEREGWAALYAELKRIDPQAAAGIEPQNRHRIQRALEVFEISGRPISSFWSDARSAFDDRFDATLIECAIVPPDRAALHRRIAERIDGMLRQGLVDEVRRLRDRNDLNLDCPAMRAVGYRQVWQYLDGSFDRTEMLERLNAATRQLAKKQMTWLRRWEGVEVVATPDAAFEWLIGHLDAR